MTITKIASVLGALICIGVFGISFIQIQFGYNVPPPNTPAIDVFVIKCVCAALTLMAIWALVVTIRAPALRRSR